MKCWGTSCICHQERGGVVVHGVTKMLGFTTGKTQVLTILLQAEWFHSIG